MILFELVAGAGLWTLFFLFLGVGATVAGASHITPYRRASSTDGAGFLTVGVIMLVVTLGFSSYGLAPWKELLLQWWQFFKLYWTWGVVYAMIAVTLLIIIDVRRIRKHWLSIRGELLPYIDSRGWDTNTEPLTRMRSTIPPLSILQYGIASGSMFERENNPKDFVNGVRYRNGANMKIEWDELGAEFMYYAFFWPFDLLSHFVSVLFKRMWVVMANFVNDVLASFSGWMFK